MKMIDISFKFIPAAHPYEQYNIVVRRNVAQVSVPESGVTIMQVEGKNFAFKMGFFG